MHSRVTDRRSASKCQGKWPDQTLDQALGLPEVLVAVSTSRLSCKRAGKTRTLMPVWDSSGESRLRRALSIRPGSHHCRKPTLKKYLAGAVYEGTPTALQFVLVDPDHSGAGTRCDYPGRLNDPIVDRPLLCLSI